MTHIKAAKFNYIFNVIIFIHKNTMWMTSNELKRIINDINEIRGHGKKSVKIRLPTRNESNKSINIT